MFELSAGKIRSLEASWPADAGAPVFTVDGRYQSRGWTEWTQGFQFGSAILQFDATGDTEFLELGRTRTVERMAPHLTHVGVHDHGFNNVSTYGGLWRLAREGRIDAPPWELRFYELALKVSGAVQAKRWTRLPDGGYIYSFNGAHSLFVDTIRSLRALAVSHMLGHRLSEEQDASIDLLERLVQHAHATARFAIYYGTDRDTYDVRGRTAHESLFNAANGTYRGPSTQQGYSPFSTWTRGLAWAMTGFAEQLEFLATRGDEELQPLWRTRGGRELDARRGARDLRLLHRPGHRSRRHPVLGHRRTRVEPARWLGGSTRRPVQRARARRQFGRGDCRAGPAAPLARARAPRRRRRPLRAGGPPRHWIPC